MKLRIAIRIIAAAALTGAVARYVDVSGPVAQPNDGQSADAGQVAAPPSGAAPASPVLASAEPTSAEPTSAEPASPQPASAEPASPAPASAEPANPAPASPEPASAAAADPAAVVSAPVGSAPVTPAPTTSAAASPAPAATASAPASGNPLWTIPLKQLSFTQDRPIFSPSRRPPPPVVAPVYVAPVVQRAPSKPREPERPAISLVGTVASETEALGVFLETATRNVVRLRIGEDHEGWVLRSIKGRAASLEKNDQAAVLEMAPPGTGEAALMANSALGGDPPPRRPPRR